MFEGKNIHYTSEGKPLCSFSNKLCRQRRLNRYAFCIRHILEDTSSPFKRCQYVTRNNNKICQNPIPTKQERRFCHAHMQCAGIIPRTERKVKNPVVKGDASTNGGVQNSKANSNNTNNNHSSNNNNVKKDPNAVFKFEEEHSEIQWIPKGGSINGIVNGGKTGNVSKGKDLQNLLKKEFAVNGDIFKGNNSNGTSVQKREGKDDKKNPEPAVQIVANGVHPVKAKSRQTYGKKSNGKTVNTDSSSLNVNSTQLNSCVRDRWKKEEESNHYHNNKDNDKKINELKCGDVVPCCIPGQDASFEQLQTLKTVENSVVKLDGREQKSKPLNGSVKHVENAKAVLDSNDSLIRTASLIPTFIHNYNNYNNNSLPVNKNKEVCKGLVSVNNRKSSNCNLNNSHGVWGTPADLHRRNWETRQEFLSRVRQAVQSQYLSIKNSTKESEKKDKIFKMKLRKTLMTCVVKDSSLCAHVIVQNDPSKYSDAESNDKFSKVIETTGSSSVDKEIPAKHKKAVTLNGTHTTTTTKKRKNGECLKTDYDNGKLVTSNITEIKDSRNSSNSQNAVLLNGSLKSNGNRIEIKSLSSLIGKKSKSKDSKRSTKQDGAEDKSLLDIKSKPQPSKRKPRNGATKSTEGDIFSGTLNNQIGAVEKQVVSSTMTSFSHKIINDANSINNCVNGMNGSTSVINKKRKFGMGDETKPNGMDTTSTFRVPKLEDSTSTNFNSIDVKLDIGNLLSSFNAHLSNHSLFHPNSTSSANTALATAQQQLQQILSQPDLRSLTAEHNRNQGMDTVLNSVGSSDMGTSDGVITDASFDSTFDHSASSQQDCEFSDDDDLEKSFEFQLDPETEKQATRLLEDNELTEDDLNELFPETRIGDNKIGRSDLSDIGIDFASPFDANDIDYSLFNIFPFNRSNQSESISVTNQF